MLTHSLVRVDTLSSGQAEREFHRRTTTITDGQRLRRLEVLRIVELEHVGLDDGLLRDCAHDVDLSGASVHDALRRRAAVGGRNAVGRLSQESAHLGRVEVVSPSSRQDDGDSSGWSDRQESRLAQSLRARRVS